MEYSSSLVQHQPFQHYLLRWEFQLDKLPQNDCEKDAGTKGRRKKCGKIEIYSDEPVFSWSDKFLIREKSDCIQRSGETHSYGKPESRMRRNSKSDAASSSQVRLQDAHRGGQWTQPRRTCRYKRGIRKCGPFRVWNLEFSRRNSLRRDPVLVKKATVKPNASSKSDQRVSAKAERKEWSHNLHVCPATVHHAEAVFSIVSGIYGREHDDPMDDLDVNMAIWGTFLNATLRAAVHLGQDHEANLRYVKNQGLSVQQRQSLRLLRLCALRGKNGRWSYCELEDQDWMVFGKQSLKGYESNRWNADGVRVEKYSQESQRWASSRRFKVWWETYSVNLSTSKTGSSSCQCTTTLHGEQKEVQKDVNIQFTDSCGICS